jgi:hypothetical protein
VGASAPALPAGGQRPANTEPAPARFRPAQWLKEGLIQAEGWHEPYIFVVRRGGQALNADEAIGWAAREVPVSIDGPPHLVANPVSQRAQNRAMLHLLNYNHEKAPLIQSIPVAWKLQQSKSPRSVQVFSPEFSAPQSLPFTVAGSTLKFLVPALRMYTFAVVSW